MIITLMATLMSPVADTAAQAPQAQSTPDPAKLAVARDIVDLVLPPDRRDAMFQNIIDAMMGNIVAGQTKALDLDELFTKYPEVRDIFGKFLRHSRDNALADLKQYQGDLLLAYANAYARTFSVEELIQIKSFLGTEAGQKFATRSTALFNDPDVSAWMRKAVERSQRQASQDLEQLQVDIKAAIARADVPHDHS